MGKEREGIRNFLKYCDYFYGIAIIGPMFKGWRKGKNRKSGYKEAERGGENFKIRKKIVVIAKALRERHLYYKLL